jgi:ubiquinone biosynthesis monooxygenase Coq7
MSIADRIVGHLDRGLRTLAGVARGTQREYPGASVDEGPLDEPARRHAAGLMRVNHAGEVAAQALYHGQSLTARSGSVQQALEQAAREEIDHLNWCRQRLDELEAAPSRLDPLWYAGAFVVGAAAGLAGDRVNLGFLAETERQVVEHLDRHLRGLPAGDLRSRALLAQMREDEAHHASTAVQHGAAEFPTPVKRLMQRMSAVMTGTSYWV